MTSAKAILKFRIKDDCKKWEIPILRSGQLKIVRVKCKPPIKNSIRWHLEIEGEQANCDRALELFASGNTDINPLPAKTYGKGDRVLFCCPPDSHYSHIIIPPSGQAIGIGIEGRVIDRDLNCAEPHAIVDIGTAIITAAPRFLVLLEKVSPEAIEPLAPEFNWKKSEDSLGITEALYFGERFCGLLAYWSLD